MSKKKYFTSLDLFRGFCGYGVAISHLHAFVYKNIFIEYLSILFVEFFFILSGFVLYPQLLKVLDNKKNLIIFFKRRWMRTLPLFFIVLVSVSVLTGEILSKDFFKYLILIQKTFPDFINNDYYPVAWSLSIEEFFYILFPVILINLNKNNFIKITIFIIFFITFIKFLTISSFDTNFYRTGTFLRFDAILLGFALCHFKDKLFMLKSFNLFFLLLGFLIYFFGFNYFTANQDHELVKFSFIILLQLISCFTLLGFIRLEKFLKGDFIKKISLLISQQTYSIYLFHIILIYLIDTMRIDVPFITFYYILTLFLFSTLIYNFIEKPILKLRPKI